MTGRFSRFRLTIYAVNSIFGPVNILPTNLFAALSHDTRLRCMLLLAYKEMCVCELTDAIGAVQPHMSRHLAQLREAGLVLDRRDGLWIYYRINPGLPEWVLAVLDQAAQGVDGVQPYDADLAALPQSTGRQERSRCA